MCFIHVYQILLFNVEAMTSAAMKYNACSTNILWRQITTTVNTVEEIH